MDENYVVDGKRFQGTREQAEAYARRVGKPLETHPSGDERAQGRNPDETPVVSELRQ